MTTVQRLTAKQMAECDRHTIEDIGIPSLVLMERAALATAQVVMKQMAIGRVLVACGVGNNGGDGLAVARLLHLKGVQVTILLLGNPKKATEQTAVQLKICRHYKIPVLTELPADLDTYTTVIDAIFGIGLSRPIEGRYATTIEALNKVSAGHLAVDIASGVSADTGAVLGIAFKADVTVTMAYQKIGQTVAQGPTYCGNLIVADIGIYLESEEFDN